MHFNIVTVFPDMFTEPLRQGVVGQGLKKDLLSVTAMNPRTFTEDFHKTVDDRPYGGGDGMVLLAEPLQKALENIQATRGQQKTVYLSAQGRPWSDKLAREWAIEGQEITLVCGRYGGVDQRFIDAFVDEEISIGDYVLSGGELAAMVVIDSVARFIPGVLGNSESLQKDSFANGLLEGPVWTRPQEILGKQVPELMMSGHHERIEQVRHHLSVLYTLMRRPDLIDLGNDSPQDKSLHEAMAWLRDLPVGEQENYGFSEAVIHQIEDQFRRGI